jgi:hypothetical protein
MFQSNIDHADANRLKQLAEDHPNETISCYGNLNKVIELLDGGRSLQSIGLNFLKSERGGVYAIYQKRTPSSLEIRLYVGFNEKKKIYYILGIGDKKTQRKDIDKYQKVIEKNKLSKKEDDNDTPDSGSEEDHDDC